MMHSVLTLSSRRAAAAVKKPGRCEGPLRVLTTAGGRDQPPPDRAATAAKGVGTSKGGGAGGVALKSVGIGTGAGAIGSLVGMGGGFVAIPFLTGWLGLSQHQAHGTSLGAVFATGVAGSTAYALAGHVDYQAAGAMSLAGMAAAHAGARSTGGVDGRTLKLALGVLMLAVAPMLPLRDKLLPRSDGGSSAVAKLDRSEEQSEEQSEERSGEETARRTAGRRRSKAQEGRSTVGARRLEEGGGGRVEPSNSSSVPTVSPVTPLPGGGGGGIISEAGGGDGTLSDFPGSGKVVKMFAIGAGSGFLAGVFGVGGGILTVPAISLATDLGHKEVLGTSLAAMVLPAFIGSITHFRQGNLVPRIAFPLALGTGAGAFLGGKYAARHLDEETLKLAFCCLMLFLGTRTVAGARAAAASKVAKRAP